ncbi:RloB-like protein [Tessaracoccus bendigoensis DSM 12906]|uniref:RloB-like protein n=1 Tax=Tessaracoccus bendigoensis DSM 12906 TaxID=1123357 RepID=A0A1M6FQD9_9ACTN|nr:RloB family protein [Tessaracoccus bendigoensis]SHI99809.1 RloB-like protein [Tessaracoccus bendigoensis DSM 12906]
MVERRSSRGHSRPSRKTKRTVLIVTNGERTEMSYLSEVKSRARKDETTITVKFLNGSPDSILRKLSSPHGDVTDYDEVWIVVDEDGADRTQFLHQCAKKCRRNQTWQAVISRPCFEVWLIAHYTAVRNYVDQNEAQRHYRQLIGKNVPTKALPNTFPFDEAQQAVSRSHLPNDQLKGMEELPPSPGTAVPYLMRALRRVDFKP